MTLCDPYKGKDKTQGTKWAHGNGWSVRVDAVVAIGSTPSGDLSERLGIIMLYNEVELITGQPISEVRQILGLEVKR